MSIKQLAALAALFQLAGCSGTMPPMPTMDVTPISTQSGDRVRSTDLAMYTGRDWNAKPPHCGFATKACY